MSIPESDAPWYRRLLCAIGLHERKVDLGYITYLDEKREGYEVVIYCRWCPRWLNAKSCGEAK